MKSYLVCLPSALDDFRPQDILGVIAADSLEGAVTILGGHYNRCYSVYHWVYLPKELFSETTKPWVDLEDTVLQHLEVKVYRHPKLGIIWEDEHNTDYDPKWGAAVLLIEKPFLQESG